MAEASKEEIAKTLALWSVAQQGKTSREWKGFVSKYNLQDPFDPWPPTKERIEIFTRRFQETILANTEAPINIANTISTQKLDELVDEFNREYAKVKTANTEAEKRAKNHIQEIIRHTIEKTDVDPNQKNLLFRETTAQSTDNPSLTITEAEANAVAVLEKAQPFINEKSFDIQEAKFSKLGGLTAVQKGITAPLADTLFVVAPGLRPGIINRNLADVLLKAIDPNTLIDKLGIKAVDSLAFKQVVHGIQAGVSQTTPPRSASTFVEGIFSSVFHKAYVDSAEQSVTTYWKLYQMNLAQGLPPPNANQFMASSMGLGSQALHLGTDYMFSKARGAALKAGLAKLGLSAIPGAGWGALAFDFATRLLGKLGGWLKGLVIPTQGMSATDWWVIAIVAIVAFLPIMMFTFQQDFMINPSLATRLQLGGPGNGGLSLPPYAGAPAVPSDVTGCPTKNKFSLTQCPAGEYSHARLWAYDVGIPNYTPILATHDGVVAIIKGEKQSDGYGNMIEIKGIDTKGKTYYTLYGHLATINVPPGKQVKAGDEIGRSDDTGNSSGPHLHYEYRDGNNNASPAFGVDFLPAGCVTNPGTCNLK